MTIFAWFVALTLRVTVVLAASIALGRLSSGSRGGFASSAVHAHRDQPARLAAPDRARSPLGAPALAPVDAAGVVLRAVRSVRRGAADRGAGRGRPTARPPAIADPAASTARRRWARRDSRVALGSPCRGPLARRSSRPPGGAVPWLAAGKPARRRVPTPRLWLAGNAGRDSARGRGPGDGAAVDERRDRDALDQRLVAALGAAAVIGPCLAGGAAEGGPAA